MTKSISEIEELPKGKKNYQQPELKHYGSVRSLTQTGSDPGSESDSNKLCTDIRKKTCK